MFGKNGNGGQWTLKYTFNAMSFAASVDVVAFVTRYVFFIIVLVSYAYVHYKYSYIAHSYYKRSILLTLNDFDFALKATLIAAVVYIPGIIVATVGVDRSLLINQSHSSLLCICLSLSFLLFSWGELFSY